MEQSDVQRFKHGLYKLFWKDGGSSLASVGSNIYGRRWFAPTNWVTVPSFNWEPVLTVELVMSTSSEPATAARKITDQQKTKIGQLVLELRKELLLTSYYQKEAPIFPPAPLDEVEQNARPTYIAPRRAFAHFMWMLDEITKMDDEAKANRWLGWIQGVMWAYGWQTLREQRDQTREIMKATSEEKSG